MTYESRHRLTWAARYPLLPGADRCTRQALLLQIADAAVTGQYFESQKKLAERVGMSVRSVRRVLVKLVSEGVLSARSRGFKKTTRYTLQRLDEVAEHGDFLPFERTPTSAQTTEPPPFERTPVSARIRFERTPVSAYEDILHEVKPPLTPPFIQSAPEPETEPGKISTTARKLHDHLIRETMRPLPAAWVSYPELKQRVEPLNFPRLASVLAVKIERMSGFLPEPQDFFASYVETAPKTKRKRKKDRKHKREAA